MLLLVVRKMAKNTFVHVMLGTRDLGKNVLISMSVKKNLMTVTQKPTVVTPRVDLSALAKMVMREMVDNVLK